MVNHCVRLVANQTKEAVNRDAIELLSSMLDGNNSGAASPVQDALALYLENSFSNDDGVASGFLTVMESLLLRCERTQYILFLETSILRPCILPILHIHPC